MDRIHRLNQTRPVRVVRFVMQGIEERIVALQEAKSLQAKAAMQKLKPEEQRRARLNDLKGLLEIEWVNWDGTSIEHTRERDIGSMNRNPVGRILSTPWWAKRGADNFVDRHGQ